MLLNASFLKAEGIHGVAPNSTDLVMLLIGDENYGNFATATSSESSRLYVQFAEPGEILYLGLSREFSENGNSGGTGNYSYVIKKASDNTIVHGPYTISSFTENLSSWEDAIGPDVLTGGVGYATDHNRYHFTAEESGLYYIEFSSARYIGLWDFTMANNGVEIPGRVFSKNWAFRTPKQDNNLPECVWDREFNGALYSYTSDGFVTRLDFANSGLQGLSFTMAFNSNGPGNTGDITFDRMSVAEVNLDADFAEHLVFLSEPDPVLFPDGDCGEISVTPFFQCTSDDAYCLDVTVTQPGQLEVVIDFNNNNIYEEDIDRRLLYRFDEGSDLNHCLYWDGLLGDGTIVDPGATVNLLIKYTQGVQHWSVFDAEFLKEGFCVEPIRPICNTNDGTDFLYWDDRNILEEPGTGQPKDGTNGCNCDTDACRTWNNFNPNTEDCSQINDNVTTGYGDKNILNTWWFANVEELSFANVPLISVAIEGDNEICQNEGTSLSFMFTSSADIVAITWTGPNGIIAQGPDAPSSIVVDTPGIYTVEITDANGCSYTDDHELDFVVCETDIELDITVNDTTPEVCDTVSFTINLSNVGDMVASDVHITAYWDQAVTNIHLISHGGQWNGNMIVWNNLNLAIGESVNISFSAKVRPAFDYVISAEVTGFTQGDTDSTPNNGVDTDADGNCADDEGDEDDGDCVILSPAACSIQATITNVLCDANGTFENENDDTYTFDLTVTGSGSDLSWSGQLNGQVISGNYGDIQNFGPFAIANGNISASVQDDFFSNTCTTTATAVAPTTCSDQCVLSLEEGDIICSDNGTTDDSSDDTYTVRFRLTGFNTFATWTASDGSNNSYNTWQTYGPYNINDGNLTLNFVDDNDNACSISHTFIAPITCSTDCSIQGTVGQAVCSDNGTPSDPTDDTFTFTINMSGFNTSTNGWLANDALSTTGAYDNPIVMGPYAIEAGNLSFQITDIDEAGCSFTVNVQAPTTCSNLCVISLEEGGVNCLDNGTLTDPSDDMFTVQVRLTGLNTAGQWLASNDATGAYNEWITLGPFLINDGDVNLTFIDSGDADCIVSAIFQTPSTCSNSCVMNASVSTSLCTNSGTPSDPSDDTFSFLLTVNGSNISSGWIANDALGSTGVYSEAVLMGPFPISEGNLIIILTDNDDPNCTTIINVQPPSTCSELCSINAIQSGAIFCADAGTPTIAEDDVFSFTVVVAGANTAGEWTASNGQTGIYGEEVVIGVFPIADGTATVTFTDNDDPNCVSSISVNAPPTCSNTCAIHTVDVTNIVCDDNGTPVDPTDDTFTFDINIEGNNVGEQWTAASGESGQYGEDISFGPYDIASGEVNFVFTDSENNECTATTTVNAPTTCSNQCAIETTVSNIVCLDNNTPFDPNDDLFTFDLLVTTINHTGNSWIAGEFGGSYGVVQNQGPFLIANGLLNLTVEDIDDESCISLVQVTPPVTCSDECLLTVEIITTSCDDMGTELDVSDDIFSYTIQVNGINGGTTWTASDGTTGSYGENVQSIDHSYSNGTLEITIVDDLLGCSANFAVSPPAPNLFCPEDTDQRSYFSNIQVIRGFLGDTSDIVISEPPCILALGSRPMGVGDRFLKPPTVTTSDGDTTEIVRTFYLYSNIEATDDFSDAKDGYGGLFRGDYLGYTDPCCFNINYPDTLTNDTLLINMNPQVDTTDIFDQEMELVQRFTHAMKGGQDFTLMISTFSPGATGDFAWVIVSESLEQDSLVVNSTDVTSEFFTGQEIAEDLTLLDISWIQDTANVSQQYVGYPMIEPYCGADSLYMEDRLFFIDSCTSALIERAYYLNYGGQTDSCLQELTFRRPDYDDIILPPATFTLECGENYPLNPNGFPDPLVTGYPLLFVGDEYIPMFDTTDYFNLAVSYKDIPQTDTSGLELNLLREWTFTDFCTGETQIVPQLIKVGDFLPPAIRCPLGEACGCPSSVSGVMLFDVDPNECTASIDIPAPIITGFCDTSRVEEWFVMTELLMASDSSVLDSIFNEDDRLIANLERGEYLLRYSMENEQGYRIEQMCGLRIIDLQPPSALCVSNITILLSEIENSRIFPEDIDIGSSDNCIFLEKDVRRFYDENALNCDLQGEEGYGEWSPYVDFGCCDEGESYVVGLRVMDLDSNINDCTTLIEIIDDVAPELYGLDDMQITCSELPFNFDPTDSLQLVALFGYPEVNDNCLENSWELETELNWNDCELGSIRRRFKAIDRAGNTTDIPYEQLINISGDNSYGIRFEADKVTVCLDDVEIPAFRSGGCGVFEISYKDIELAVLADECRRIQRTYSIINACDYDGVSPAVQITRNEDCDGIEGEEAVWVIIENGQAFIDADSLSLNSFPLAGTQGTSCTATTNPEGYWRAVDNVGYWMYSQIITVEDDSAPTVIYTAPEPFCSVDERCETLVTILVEVQADCTEERVDISLWWDQDANGTLDQDLTETTVLSGTWPNYKIEGDFPLGNHTFVFGAKDGCENETIEPIAFTVVDCYIEQPICKTAMEVQLNPIIPAIDLNGDGILDEGAFILAAGLLVEEMLDDCSMNYSFSVNKIANSIDFALTNLILTCEDRYTATREVVVKDNAFNPYAIQPDGTIGGPNYSTCLIQISVQDEQEICSACVENELEIEGIIVNRTNQPISDVGVKLYQNDEFTGNELTINDGKFEFTDLPLSTNFEVKPFKNDDTSNGVTTLDLIILQKHLLLIDIITDPYLLLAADVNHSGTVTILDLLIIQSMLLGNIETFPNNTSWRFIPAAFPLTDISADIPDSYTYNNLIVCQFTQDFIGIKIGDLNGSANLSSSGFTQGEVTNRSLWTLHIDDMEMKAGDLYRIPIYLTDAEKASGLEMNLMFDPTLLTVVEIESGLIESSQMATQYIKNGQLKGIWLAGNNPTQENTLMTLVIKAVADAKLSDVLHLNKGNEKSFVYDHKLSEYTADLVFSEGVSELILLGNVPDPFRDYTEIEFYLPRSDEFLLEIRDMNGKLIQAISKQGTTGIQKIKLIGNHFPAGVLYYTLIFDGQMISRRMVKL